MKHKIERKWLEAEYITKKQTIEQIAMTVGCTTRTVYKRLKQYQITTRHRRYDLDNNDICKRYKAGCGPAEIGRQLNCNPQTVVTRLVKMGIYKPR